MDTNAQVACNNLPGDPHPSYFHHHHAQPQPSPKGGDLLLATIKARRQPATIRLKSNNSHLIKSAKLDRQCSIPAIGKWSEEDLRSSQQGIRHGPKYSKGMQKVRADRRELKKLCVA